MIAFAAPQHLGNGTNWHGSRRPDKSRNPRYVISICRPEYFRPAFSDPSREKAFES